MVVEGDPQPLTNGIAANGRHPDANSNSTGRHVALITGVTGQDGSYLSELLLSKGYRVHGIKRRASSYNTARVDHLMANPNFHLHYGDVTDLGNLAQLVQQIQPTEFYNLAAQSHVKVSFDAPVYTNQVDGVGVYNCLEAVRTNAPSCRFYQASTSELFGGMPETAPQSESTAFYPRSPYSVGKLTGYWAVVNYREAYGLHASNGVLFNHESPRRGETFVTRKITMAAARIKLAHQQQVELGNLDAKRDWGHARDYVEAMWCMLQADRPDDYVVATGETTTVRDFCTMAFAAAGLPLTWEGKGVDEVGVDASGAVRVRINPKYYRPTEVEVLLGDASKIKNKLGWASSTNVNSLCTEMVKADIASVR